MMTTLDYSKYPLNLKKPLLTSRVTRYEMSEHSNPQGDLSSLIETSKI